MPRFAVTATVSVDVEMSIEAESADAARKKFHDNICMTASLVDVPEPEFDVSEDSISGVNELRVRKEAV